MEEGKSSKAQGGHPTVPFTEKRLQLNDLELLYKGFEVLYDQGKREFNELVSKGLQKSKQDLEHSIAEEYLVKHLREVIHKVGGLDSFR